MGRESFPRSSVLCVLLLKKAVKVRESFPRTRSLRRCVNLGKDREGKRRESFPRSSFVCESLGKEREGMGRESFPRSSRFYA
eukprot:8759609-Heterocapsa_arctica.AAC.1